MTSAYGWRSDPFTGESRFHRGVDLRASYGTEVPAASGGTVVCAGERGTYGNLVVVRDGQGVETRYAHLSATLVKEGDVIAAGTPDRPGRLERPLGGTALALRGAGQRRTRRPRPVGGSRRERTIKVR